MVKENGMVMVREAEYDKLVERFNNLQRATTRLLKKIEDGSTEDARLSREEFVEVYEAALDQCEEREETYGHEVTVHWHGLYCNCDDGAQAYNYIIDAIKGITDELGDDEDM